MDRPQGRPDEGANRLASRTSYYRLSLLALLVVVIPAALIVALDEQLGLDVLRQHQWAVLRFVAGEPLVASLLFMVVYGLAVAVSLPGAAFLTMAGGLLFGWLHATVCVLIAGTAASIGLFLFARGTLAEAVRSSAGPSIRRFAQGFRTNALSYVFMLHLVPIFPYGMIIALPAAFGVRLHTFVIGAFLGILPGTLLLAHLGAGLGHIFWGDQAVTLQSFLTPQILTAALGLGALCLLPLVYRMVRTRGRSPGAAEGPAQGDG